jgi:hypothetical protein
MRRLALSNVSATWRQAFSGSCEEPRTLDTVVPTVTSPIGTLVFWFAYSA